MKFLITILFICGASLVFAIGAVTYFGDTVARISDSISAIYASVLVTLANQERLDQNISELSVNPLLEKAAQAKAEDMAARGYFSHDSPEGKTPWEFLDEAEYKYLRAGENLAVNFEDSEEVHEAWAASPLHWRNIMNSKFTEIGVATSTGLYKGREAVFVVQMFGAPR